MSLPGEWPQASARDGAVVAFSPDDAGEVVVSGRAESPIAHDVAPDAVLFGPLEIQVPADDRLRIGSFSFRRRPSTVLDSLRSSLPFGAVAATVPFFGALGASEADLEGEPAYTRRQLLLASAAAVGAGGAVSASSTPAAASQQAPLVVGEFDEVENNPRGFSIVLRDRVQDILPADQSYTVRADGIEVASFSADRPRATIPAGVDGVVSIHGPGRFDTINEIRQLTTIWDPREYAVDLPQPATEYDAGETVAVTSERALVDPLTENGPDRTVVTLGGRSLAHESESRTDTGAWRVKNGRIQYLVGESPPDAATLHIAAGVSRGREYRDDASRLFSFD